MHSSHLPLISDPRPAAGRESGKQIIRRDHLHQPAIQPVKTENHAANTQETLVPLIPTRLKGMEHCIQEIFDKPQVAAELRRFAAGAPELSEDAAKDREGWTNALISWAVEADNLKSDKPQKDEAPQTGEPTTTQTQDNETTESRPQAHHEPVQKTALSDPENVETTEGAEEGTAKESVSSCEGHTSTEDTRWPSHDLAQWVQSGRSSSEDDGETLTWLDATVKSLQRALRGYDMTAELLGARLTPNAALVRFRGADELTIPKVERRRQELLTSHAIDVISILAAPMEVIVMVRRPKRAILPLQDLWRQRELPETAPAENTSLLLGARESDGELLYLNVGDGFAGYEPHGPHTLIAGETGSGKGVLVQCLLLDICATNSPRSAQIRMIDPKAGIDFPWLRRMPHLSGDLITTQPEAISLFEELVTEMEQRNRLLSRDRREQAVPVQQKGRLSGTLTAHLGLP